MSITDFKRFILQLKFLLIRNGYKKANYAKKKKIFKKIGNNVAITTSILPAEPFLISIGNNVIIAAGVRIITHSVESVVFNNEEENHNYYCRFGNIEIGNNVFVGANAIIMPGIKIGDNSIISAGAIVTKDVPGNCVYAGVPAKFICSYQDLKEKNKLFSSQFKDYRGRDNVKDMNDYLLRNKESI